MKKNDSSVAELIENGTINKTKKTDLYKVDPRAIVVLAGFNVRTDFSDIADLAASIADIGLRQPLECDKQKDESWQLVDGERRFRAIQYNIENNIPMPKLTTKEGDIYIPVINFVGDDADKVAAMLATGTGQKKLAEMEQVNGVGRLLTLGLKPDEIATKIGQSVQHVYNLKKIFELPEDVKERITNGEITSTTVLNFSRNTDIDTLKDKIDTAVENKKETGTEGPATTRDLAPKPATTGGAQAAPAAPAASDKPRPSATVESDGDKFLKILAHVASVTKKSRTVKAVMLREIVKMQKDGATAQEFKDYFTK